MSGIWKTTVSGRGKKSKHSRLIGAFSVWEVGHFEGCRFNVGIKKLRKLAGSDHVKLSGSL